MNRTFRYSFILAKLYGMLARTFVGRNYEELLRLRKLEDLAARLFPPAGGTSVPSSAAPVDADEIERRILGETIRSLTDVLAILKKPNALLIHLLRTYEYQGAKSIVRAIVNRNAAQPRVPDIGKHGTLRLRQGESLEKALSSSGFSWVVPLLHERPLYEIENMLDRDYYAKLLRLARRLPARDRRGVERLTSLEISLANITWALRLRFFFSVDEEAARALFIPGLVDVNKRALTEAFQIPPDSIEGWRKWKYAWLIEDQLGESFRAPDPIRAERKAARRLYVRAHQLFHEDPFTITPIAAFFKLKQFEASMLTTAVEGLRLSVPEQEILSLAGGA